MVLVTPLLVHHFVVKSLEIIFVLVLLSALIGVTTVAVCLLLNFFVMSVVMSVLHC